MLGISLALLTAFFFALRDLLSKRLLTQLNEFTTVWWMFAVGLFILSPLTLLAPQVPLSERFWWALVVDGACSSFANILYYRAIRLSDLSLSVPLLAFTPLFMLLTSPIILGEFPATPGLIGILLIVFGSYILQFQKNQQSLWSPFRNLFHQPSSRAMLLVALLWSVTGVVDKIGVSESSPIVWLFFLYSFIFFALTPLYFRKAKLHRAKLQPHIFPLISIGALLSLALLAQMTAITCTLAAYVIAIKRTSILFAVLFGVFLLKEKQGRQRLIGAASMCAGAATIALTS